jgi:hypothetical protein
MCRYFDVKVSDALRGCGRPLSVDAAAAADY